MTLSDRLTGSALNYHRRGWRPVPLNGKAPNIGEGWQRRQFDPEKDTELFSRAGITGVGIVLGPSGLADLEADCAAAEFVLARLAPPTGCMWKSPSGRLHRLYRGAIRHREWNAPGGTESLVEVRCGNHQSAAPPSVHPETGGIYEWEREGDPAEVEEAALYRAATLAGVAGAIASVWPKGSRHRAALAAAGWLRRAGVTEEEALVLMEAVALAAKDEELDDRLTAVGTSYARSDDENTTGLPTLAQLLGQQIADWLARQLPTQSRVSSKATPTRRTIAWPDPPAEEAFHGLAGRYVRAIEPHTEADPLALLIQQLVTFGNVVGRSPHFMAEADQHHMNLFGILVGATAKGRKGTSWGQTRAIYRAVAGDWANSKIVFGLSSGEGLIWEIRDPIEKRQAIKDKGRVIDYEVVTEDPGVEDKRLLLFEGEFANVLQVLKRDGNTLSAILRHAWDGATLNTLVKTNRARATDPHISLVGHITKDELLRYLDDTQAANGFGNRFLWACVRRSKTLPEGGKLRQGDLTELDEELRAVIEFAAKVKEMRRDEGAREIWRAVYDKLSEGQPGLLGAMLARSEAQVMRLSCIYALLDRSGVVRSEHLMAGLALWDYIEASARFLFGDSFGDPLADELLELLRSSPGGRTRREIRDHFSRHENSERIARVLEMLQERGIGRCQMESTGGRPAERWFAL